MKHFTLLAMCLSLMLGASTSFSYLPPPPSPLEYRMKQSTHILVAYATAVNYVDQNGRVITPEEAFKLLPFRMIELTLRVSEPLFPASLRRNSMTKLRVPFPIRNTMNGPESVQSMRSTIGGWEVWFINKSKIFLARISASNEGFVMAPVNDIYFFEPMTEKPKVVAIINKILKNAKRR